MVEPIKPPATSKPPILISRLPRRKCASEPDTDAAQICVASVDTAMDGGMPKKNRMGAIRKPPPTPNNPLIAPTRAPKKIMTKGLVAISAIGRYMLIVLMFPSDAAFSGTLLLENLRAEEPDDVVNLVDDWIRDGSRPLGTLSEHPVNVRRIIHQALHFRADRGHLVNSTLGQHALEVAE